MRPELFHMHFQGAVVAVPSYVALALAGFIAAWAGMGYLAKMRGLPLKRFFTAAVILSAMVVLGSRLLYVLHSPEQFHSIRDVLYPSTKGFAVSGGIVLAVVVSWFLLPTLGYRRGSFWDIAAGPTALGFAFGRMGCFLASCCFGKVTASPLGVQFPWGSQPHRWQIREGVIGLFQKPLPVYPTQLFEMTILLMIAGLTVWLQSLQRYREGTAAAVALMLYSVFRLINLKFRADPAGALTVWAYPAGYLVVTMLCATWIYTTNKVTKGEDV